MALQARDKPDLEAALAAVMAATAGPECPRQLAQALHHAVFPGGARIRPKLCLAIAMANGCDSLELAMRAACAIELLHCASLVHDDLPCFDDADMRRGKPSVHRAYGEPIAVLVGDALIVAALEAVATGELTGDAAVRMPGVFAVVSERDVHGPPLDASVEGLRVVPRLETVRDELAAEGLPVEVECLGVNGVGYESGTGAMTSGRTLPWRRCLPVGATPMNSPEWVASWRPNAAAHSPM